MFNVRTVDQSSGTQGSFSFGDGVSFNWEILECSSSNLKANIDDIDDIVPPDDDINRESFNISYNKCGDGVVNRAEPEPGAREGARAEQEPEPESLEQSLSNKPDLLILYVHNQEIVIEN